MIETGGKMMSLRSARAAASVVSIALLVELSSVACGYAQQSTGQLLISSGFNPIAATTPAMVNRHYVPACPYLLSATLIPVGSWAPETSQEHLFPW
jgi:hypothetical protein